MTASNPTRRDCLAGAITLIAGGTIPSGPARPRPGVPDYGIAMHGEPRLSAGFDRVRYANPSAPKGGRLIQGVLGTFDSVNPFIVKGLALPQVRGYVVESLLARGYDEPFTLYGLLARTVETDAARSVRHLHPRPRGEILRRPPRNRRRRDVFLAASARQGPAELPHLLRQGRQG